MKPMVTVLTFAAAVGDGAAVAVGFGAAVGDGTAVVGAAAVDLGAAVGDGAGWEQAPASTIKETTNRAAMMSLTVPFNLIPSFFVMNLILIAQD